MWSRQDKGGNIAWEELTIHQIMAITAFPFHWDPSRDTHNHEDPLLYLEQGLPCLLLSFSLGSRRLMSTGPVPLFSRRVAPIHPPALLWNLMYLPKAKPAVSQYTHHSSLALSPPLCSLSPLRHTNRQSPVPPFHTVPGSKGGWRGMWKRAVFV